MGALKSVVDNLLGSSWDTGQFTLNINLESLWKKTPIFIMTVHMPRNASFTFEKIAFKIECIFGNFMVRGTYHYQLLILRYQNRNKKCAILPILVPSWKMSKIRQISSKPILVSQNKELKLFWFFLSQNVPLAMKFQKIHSILMAISSRVKVAVRGMWVASSVIMLLHTF